MAIEQLEDEDDDRYAVIDLGDGYQSFMISSKRTVWESREYEFHR